MRNEDVFDRKRETSFNIIYRKKRRWMQILKEFSASSDDKESACDVGAPGLIPGSGRSPGEGIATHSSILAWRIPWIEETGKL